MSNHFGSIDNIILLDYDQNYPVLFAREKQLLLNLLADDTIIIEHIGSTAVPGIKSKPVIDIQVELSNFPLSKEKTELLAQHGYMLWGGNPDLNHRFFFKGMPRTHHLHFYPAGYHKLKEHILFRNYLLQHPETALAYEEVKIKLANQYAHNREAYTNNKTRFIEAVLEKCRI